MKRLFPFVLLTFFMCLGQSAGQTLTTKIQWLAIDGKEVKKSYRIFLYSHGCELEATRTTDGFRVPDVIRNEKTVDMRLVVGKYNLTFDNIPVSRTDEDWRIEIFTRRPFGTEFDLTPKEARDLRFIYTISIGSGQNIYLVYKNDAVRDAWTAGKRR